MKRLFSGWYPILGITAILLLFSSGLHATHLMGGSMTYEYQGMVGANQSYKVTLKIYRYCDPAAGGTASLDPSMFLGIYKQDPANPTNDKLWFATENLALINSTFITPPSPGVDCSFSTTVCVEEGIFEADILLPPDPGGYHLMVERCCRNGNIANLSTPGSIGQTYYCFIPPAPIINSSPQFSDIPVPFICSGDTVTIVNNAVDPDGDQLVYSFEIPFSGYSSSVIAVPDPQFDNNPYAMPVPPVLYNPGYSLASPFGAGGAAFIDTQTGLTRYYIPNQGFFVVAIEIKEYRNGVLIASVRRDIQLIAILCPVNATPVISTASGGGQTNFTIDEGQTLCFPVTFTDPNGDSLFMTSSGTVFNSAVINPPASLANANGDGIVTSQFCWSTECGQARLAPYQFIVSVIDNGCPPKTTNQIYSITVNPSPLPPAPAVVIQQDPPGAICIGTNVTFTAIPTFGGTNPVYQWQLNGVNVGTNSNTYSNSSLANGDVITVDLVSNSTCVTATNASSPPVVMVVNPFAAPSVSIVQSPLGPVCAGTAITFTALPVNPGPTPVYQWSINGVNTGTNNPVFTSTTLAIGDQVEVSLLADVACPAAISNTITMTVNPVMAPSVLITSDATGAVCLGQLVTFRAYPTNGGPLPAFQWQINGINAGTNSNIFSTSALVNGDNVSVILTSNENCITPLTALSNVINIIVNSAASPSVSITANPSGPICKDDNIVFTATPVAGGSFPTYQWQVNGVNTGATGMSFAVSTLNNGDDVNVVMTSSLSCLTTATAVSNIITITVNPLVVVSATIAISPSTQFCSGTPVTFTSAVVNGGTNPFYQWQINGVNTGSNSSTLTSSVLMDGDRIRLLLTSNLNCVSPVVATSNQIIVDVLPLNVPAVSITANPAGPVCQGDNVVLTAAPVFGGFGPAYEWFVNGIATGITGPVFSSATLNNGDDVGVQMTSSVVCPSPATVTSNTIVMNVNPLVNPLVSFTGSPAWPVCAGTAVTFTATSVNGGTNPVYQWQINGIPSGNTTTLLAPALNDGDIITLSMGSNAVCPAYPTAYADTVIADVIPYLIPQVAIYASPSGPVCAGDSISFSAAFLNGGPVPVYQWYLNSIPAGTNSPFYSGVFNDNDTIRAIVTSSYQCLTLTDDTSNTLITQVNPNLVPSVAITVTPVGPVCPGDLITFISTVVNGGSNPSYQWYVNGLPTGTNVPAYSSTNFTNGDLVSVEMTSSEMCLVSPSDVSNIIAAQVNVNIIPSVTISNSPSGPVCDGDTITFSSVYTGGGPSPAFEWRVNGVLTGITTPVFISNQLNNNDVIDIILTSNATCALPLTDTSNNIIAIVNPLLTPVSIISADPPGIFCDGDLITYDAENLFGGLTPGFQWILNGTVVGTNNDTLISSDFLDGDTLVMLLTSSETCLAVNPVLSNELIIDRHPPLEPLLTAPDKICFGEEIFLEATVSGGNGGPYYLTVDNNLGSGTSFTFIPYQTATYTLTAEDSCSVTRYYAATVIVNPLPVPEFVMDPPSATILNPTIEFIDKSENAAQWNWSFGDGGFAAEQNPFHTFTDPGYYTIELITESAEGCIDSTSSEIYIENVITFYIPNAFTPNQDGKNDQFTVTGYSISGFDMQIFDRWGQLVYESSGPKDGWNGNDRNAKPCMQGVYTYRLKIHNDPKNEVREGIVNLVR